MQRSTLRDLLKANLYEGGDAWTDAQLDHWLNEALQHVAGLIATIRPSILYIENSFSTANPGGDSGIIDPLSMSSADFDGVQSIQYARLSGTATWLDVVSANDVPSHMRGGIEAEPAVFVMNDLPHALEPQDLLELKITYLPVIPNMADDTDEPGQGGGSGIENFIPERFQYPMVSYATSLVYATETRGADEWLAVFNREIQAALGMAALSNEDPQP